MLYRTQDGLRRLYYLGYTLNSNLTNPKSNQSALCFQNI